VADTHTLTLEQQQKANLDAIAILSMIEEMYKKIGDNPTEEEIKKFWGIDDKLQSKDFNPYHVPAGSPEGGQFTSGEGYAGSEQAQQTREQAAKASGLGPLFGLQEAPAELPDEWIGHSNLTRGTYNDHSHFPNLNDAKIVEHGGYQYNCVAWAMGDDKKFWWPGHSFYWPRELKSQIDMKANFSDLLENVAHAVRTKDESYEPGFVKVALFMKKGEPQHMARLTSDGWTSKLGGSSLIVHDLHAMDGGYYGSVDTIYKIPIREWKKLRTYIG